MQIKSLLVFVLTVCMLMPIMGQIIDKNIEAYNSEKILSSSKVIEYSNVDGSPYSNNQFTDGTIYLKDTSVIKTLLRYNLYTGEMEYQTNGNNYVIGNPEIVGKVVIDQAVYMYLPFIKKRGFFEILVMGKSFLVQKSSVRFNPAVQAGAYKEPVPAKFTKEKDEFYIVLNNSQSIEIKNLKSIVDALQDQKAKIEIFIKQEKIKNSKKENLIKIVNYYNTL